MLLFVPNMQIIKTLRCDKIPFFFYAIANELIKQTVHFQTYTRQIKTQTKLFNKGDAYKSISENLLSKHEAWRS